MVKTISSQAPERRKSMEKVQRIGVNKVNLKHPRVLSSYNTEDIC